MMKHNYLFITLSLIPFTSIYSMDSDQSSKIEHGIFEDNAPTPEQDQALFEIDQKLFRSFLNAQRTVTKSKQVCQHLRECLGASFLQGESKETMTHLVAQAETIHYSLTQLIKAFDATLNTDDSSPLASPALSLRKSLKEKFEKYNKDWNTVEQKLITNLNKELSNFTFCSFPQQEQIETTLKKMEKKDTEKKLVYITELAFDLENQLPTQIEFLNVMNAFHKLLHLKLKAEKPLDLIALSELKSYLQKKSLRLQLELNKEIEQEMRNSKDLKKQYSRILSQNNKKAKTVLEELKEEHALLVPLTKKETYLTKPTKSTLAKYLSELQTHIDKLSSNKSDSPANPELCASPKLPAAKRAPSVPVCKIPVTIASRDEINQLKACYPQNGMWIIKKLINPDEPSPETKKLYFFSQGKLINSNQAAKKSSSKKSLKGTTCLLYENAEATEEAQRDNQVAAQTELCYTNAGIYYFINGNTADDNAYKIDFIAAESSIEKQPAQTQIEPQVRNSADNKE